MKDSILNKLANPDVDFEDEDLKRELEMVL